MRRGDLVTAVFPGDYGKPRPGLVIQGDAFSESISITLLPLTSDLYSAHLVRIMVEPDADNGLERRSQIMIDKPMTLSRSKVRGRIGQIDAAIMRRVNTALAHFLELA